MNLLRFSEDEIHFRKSKIRFYHNSQGSHKGSGSDLSVFKPLDLHGRYPQQGRR
jgi:hypothetical protein